MWPGDERKLRDLQRDLCRRSDLWRQRLGAGAGDREKGKQPDEDGAGSVQPHKRELLLDQHHTLPYGTIFFLRSDVTNPAGTPCAPNPQQTEVPCPTGSVIFTNNGNEGAIDDKPTTDLNDVPGATNYVSLALQQAMAGKQVETSATRPHGCSVKYADATH
jgi:hypothetical protein